jgi:hypothetical protein
MPQHVGQSFLQSAKQSFLNNWNAWKRSVYDQTCLEGLARSNRSFN